MTPEDGGHDNAAALLPGTMNFAMAPTTVQNEINHATTRGTATVRNGVIPRSRTVWKPPFGMEQRDVCCDEATKLGDYAAAQKLHSMGSVAG